MTMILLKILSDFLRLNISVDKIIPDCNLVYLIVLYQNYKKTPTKNYLY